MNFVRQDGDSPFGGIPKELPPNRGGRRPESYGMRQRRLAREAEERAGGSGLPPFVPGRAAGGMRVFEHALRNIPPRPVGPQPVPGGWVV